MSTQSHIIAHFILNLAGHSKFTCSKPIAGPRQLLLSNITVVVPDEELKYLKATLPNAAAAGWLHPMYGPLDSIEVWRGLTQLILRCIPYHIQITLDPRSRSNLPS